MRVKICGLTRAQDVELACDLGAWAAGFIFAPGSPRLISPAAAAELRKKVKPGTLAVGVFADAPKEEILSVIALCRLDAVQLHGMETPLQCQGLGAPVFKSLSVKQSQDLELLKRYNAEGFLLEPARSASQRAAGIVPGPTEQEAVWAAAAALGAHRVVLAGGLSSENVGRAISAAKPYAVDVSGGVESAPGVKDEAKLKAFFEAAK